VQLTNDFKKGSGVYNPLEVELPKGVAISSVACGGNHTLAVTTTGKAMACGKNEYGRLGLGDLTNRLFMCELELPESIQQVACGGSHSLFVTTSGKVYACGRGEFGRLGTGTEVDYSAPLLVELCAGKRVDSAACGGQHSFCVYSEP